MLWRCSNPEILICDEPTTALDVTIQARILELINDMKREKGSFGDLHHPRIWAWWPNMADRVCVMYAGRIVEVGTCEDIFYRPAHPYTWALLSAMPDLHTEETLFAIPGAPPNMLHPPKGDAFAARNKYAMKIDFEKEPPYFKISDTHYAATWLLHPDAPKVEMPDILKHRIARMREEVGYESDNRKERDHILQVEHLSMHFTTKKRGKTSVVKAVDDVSFYVERGETFGLVGESGCGKTTTGRTIIRLYDPTSGTVSFDGKEISGKMDKSLRKYITDNIAMIFQDPIASLNPRMTVQEIIAEGLRSAG